MCKCTPHIRTLFCGKPGCEWPQYNAAAQASDPGFTTVAKTYLVAVEARAARADELERELIAAKDEIAHLNDLYRHDKWEKEIHALRNELETEKRRVAAYKVLKHSMENERSIRSEEMRMLEIEASSSEVDGLRDAVALLTDESERQQQEIAVLKAELSQAKEERAMAIKEMDEQAQKCGRLLADVDRLKAELARFDYRKTRGILKDCFETPPQAKEDTHEA
jgi:chromosome segregation ATPase